MNNEKIDLRTPLQRKRDERNKEIYKIYLEYMNNLPEGAGEWSVFRTIAERYEMKPQGIRSVINKMKQTPIETN